MMQSTSCYEISPIATVLVLFFLYFSPCLSAERFKEFGQESNASITSNELKNMKLIEAHLSKINKPFVKSIKSPDGDIIDCVLIHLQPAFDLPELKGTMQLDPPELPKGGDNIKMKSEIKQVWSSKGESCPDGTIPIRRTTASDISRFGSISKFGKKLTISQKSGGQGHEHALGIVAGGEYYGAKGTVNLWAPHVTNDEDYSNSQIWVISNPDHQDVNVIEAGWMVYPKLTGDKLTRFFIYWTNDGFRQNGCYNLLCPGFVQVNKRFIVGGSIEPVSTYNGTQYNVVILIQKDPNTGNWWLSVDKNQIGYWPASLFPDLKNHARVIQLGGEVFNSKEPGSLTQMGSGHFPGEGFGKAAFIKNIETVDSENNFSPASNLIAASEHPKCYEATNGYNGLWEYYVFFGGPGDHTQCT